MANTVEKVRVHNAILALLQAGPYYAVAYDPDTKLAQDVDVATATPLDPDSCQTNEIASSFGADDQFRRGAPRSERERWLWVGLVKFNREVTVHEAEAAWAEPTVLPRTDTFRQVRIDLVSADYQHPTRQQSHSGTQVQFQFQVTLSRR